MRGQDRGLVGNPLTDKLLLHYVQETSMAVYHNKKVIVNILDYYPKY